MNPGDAQRRLADLLQQQGGPDWLIQRALGTPPAGRGDVSDESLRVAVALIAELLAQPAAANPVDDHRAGLRHRLLRPRTRLVVTGLPLAAAATGAAAGLPQAAIGARPAQLLDPPQAVVILASGPASALADVWACRVRSGQARNWAGFLATWAGRDRLAPRADAAGLARRWARRVGAENVHVLLDSTSVRGLPGIRTSLAPVRPVPAAAAYRLLVRVNPVLRILLDEAGQRAARARLLPLLDAEPGPGVEVPSGRRDWLAERAAVLHTQLIAGGYALHGDPENLLRETWVDSASTVRDDSALQVATRVLLHLAAPGQEADQ